MEGLNAQQRLQKERQEFLDNGILAESIPTEIKTAWLRAGKKGIDGFAKKLPDSAVLREPPEGTEVYFRYSQNLPKKRNPAESEIWNKLGVVSFSVSTFKDSLVAYSFQGNADVIRQLEKKNIKTLTSFREEDIGPNPVTISREKGQAKWFVGSENYQEPFTHYAIYCVPIGPNKLSFMHQDMYKLYFVPLEKYDAAIKSIVEYSGYECTLSSDFSTLPQVQIKDLAYMESLVRKKTSLIILRKDLKIIDVNSLACDFLGMSFEELSGTDLKDVIPELMPLCNKAFELGYIHDEPLIIPRSREKNNDFYVDCIPVKQNDTPLGMAVYLTSAKYVSRYISDVTGSTSRFSFDDIIGQNPSFQELKYAAMKVAPNNSNIFISGESGTGKELLAQAIHSASGRSRGPFVAINCGAIPKELISSELFGYESGAFTGARPGGAMGKFEQANKGTLFLDEIGEMSFDVQAALLRVLDEGAVTRLGSSRSRKVDVRIIAATNRDLHQLVREGSFRLDLFYRINVICLNTIPLRSRTDDIPLLTEYYIKKLNDVLNKEIKGLDEAAMQCLCEYTWPGNIRELRNVLERCVNLCDTPVISYNELPAEIKNNIAQTNVINDVAGVSKPEMHVSYKELERQQVQELMIKYRGNKKKVAEEMGISRGKLYRLLEQM